MDDKNEKKKDIWKNFRIHKKVTILLICLFVIGLVTLGIGIGFEITAISIVGLVLTFGSMVVFCLMLYYKF